MKSNIRFAIMATITAALMVGLCFMASGQTYGPCPGGVCPVQPQQSNDNRLSQPNYPATALHCRVLAQDGVGAGVPVLTTSKGTYIATNYHVVCNGPPGSENYYKTATVTNGSGASGSAVVVDVDRQMDVAILRINQQWQSVELGVEVPSGAVVGFHGRLVGNRVRRFTATVSGTHTDGSYYAIGERAWSGDSGGGVYYNQKLVGIMWGGTTWQGRRQTVFAPVGAVRRLLDRITGRNSVRVEVGTSVVVPPSPPQDCPTCPQSNCVERFQEILGRMDSQDSRIAKIETQLVKLPERGERGPVGPAGPQGPQGARGPAGEDADTAELELRIAKLEEGLRKEQARKVRLELYRKKGTELIGVSEGRSTVRLNVDELE